MNILVIGGTSFIGPWAVRALLAEGHRVTLFHRGRTEKDDLKDLPRILGDRHELSTHARQFREASPDAVIHMMSFTEKDAEEAVSVFAPLGVRMVVVSSMDVYEAYDLLNGRSEGSPDSAPIREEGPLRRRLYPYRGETARAPDDPRGWLDEYDKILVERAFRGCPDLNAAILRLPMVYGPGDYQHRIHPYLKRMDDGRPAVILEAEFARWRSALGYVENVARAIALAAVSPPMGGQTFNVADAAAPTTADWVRAIGRAAGWSGEVRAVPREDLPGKLHPEGAFIHHLHADTAKIRSIPGFTEPVDLETALVRTVAWERENGPPVDPGAFPYDEEDRVWERIRER